MEMPRLDRGIFFRSRKQLVVHNLRASTGLGYQFT